MNDETTEVEISLFDIDAITVTVNYPFLKQPEPMTFFLRPTMDKEEKQSRQEFFGLSEQEKEAKQHTHNVRLLAALSVRLPKNVPTFPYDPTADIRTTITDFFMGENAMKQKLVEDVLAIYLSLIQPTEFFRGL